MTTSIDELNRRLLEASAALKRVQADYASKTMKLDATTIHAITESLAKVIEMYEDIHDLSEDIVPHLQREPSIHHEDTIRLARVLGTGVELEAFGMVAEAVRLYKLFISESHPTHITDVVRSQLDKAMKKGGT